MGKIIITIFVVVSILFSITIYAGENAWIYITESENSLWFIDTEAINCQGNICRARVKVSSIGENKYMISFYEFNCAGAEYKILHTNEYDSYGNIINKFIPTKPGRMGIIPESMGEKLSNFVCQKVVLDEKQQNEDRKYEKEVTEGKLEWAKKGEEVEKSGIFTVQASAFRNASYAKAFETRLKEKGYSAYIIRSESKEGEKLYKVYIGKFTDREKAKTQCEKIRNSEGIQTFVTSLQP